MAIQTPLKIEVPEGAELGIKGIPVYSTSEAAINAAKAMAPKLRARVAEAEQLRRLPDANIDDILASGLMDLLSPRSMGGSELNYDTTLQVTAALAEGCPSTGWVYGLWSAHVWMIAQFPEAIQREVLMDQRSLVSSVVSTVGAPEVVDGGFRWTGRGFFSSGVDHCNWMTPAISYEGPNGIERRWFLIPRSDIEIVDDWNTVGLRGTGSKTVLFNNVFIPEERTLKVTELSAGIAPGALLHSNPLYHAGVEFTFSLPVAGAAVGVARSLVKTFTEKVKGRLEAGTPLQQFEQTGYLTRMARAAADVDAAEAVLLADARRYCTAPAADFDDMDRARVRRDTTYAALLCREAANSLFGSAGGSAIYESADLQRLWRDANVATAHHGLTWDIAGHQYGRSMVGLPNMTSTSSRT